MNKFNSDVDCWMLHKMATDLLNAASLWHYKALPRLITSAVPDKVNPSF